MKKWPAFSRRPFFIGSYALTHELEALFGQFGTDLFDLGRVAGLQRQLEEAAGNGHVGVGTVVQYRHHVAAAAGDDLGHTLELVQNGSIENIVNCLLKISFIKQ